MVNSSFASASPLQARIMWPHQTIYPSVEKVQIIIYLQIAIIMPIFCCFYVLDLLTAPLIYLQEQNIIIRLESERSNSKSSANKLAQIRPVHHTCYAHSQARHNGISAAIAFTYITLGLSITVYLRNAPEIHTRWQKELRGEMIKKRDYTRTATRNVCTHLTKIDVGIVIKGMFGTILYLPFQLTQLEYKTFMIYVNKQATVSQEICWLKKLHHTK